MAMSRLIFTEAELHLPNTGCLSKPRRWFSAPLPSPSSKRSEATKEKKTVAVKSFLQSYMEKHAGRFPNTKQVQDAIGGSWYLLKDILSEMREKAFPLPAVNLQEEKREEKETNLNTELKESTAEFSSLSEQTSDNNNGTDSVEEKCPKLDHNCSEIEAETEQISLSIEEKNPKLEQKFSQIEAETEQIRPSIEEKCPKLEGNFSKIETETEQINPSIEEQCPKLDQNYSQIEAETEQISSSIEEKDKNLDSSITHTKPPSLLNVIKGLKIGPKSTEIIPSYLKQDESEERELKNGTNKKEQKYSDNLVNAFKGLERKDEGLNVNLRTAKRERNRADYHGVKSILNVIREKDTIDRQNRNLSNFHDSFYFLNPNPYPSSKREGGLIDFLNKKGGNEKCTLTEKTSSDSDSADSEEEGPICEENEKCKYGLFVRFLEKDIRACQISGSIGGLCGPIESVRFLPSEKNDTFNSAVIFFKTEQGLKNALQLTDPTVCKTDVALEPMLKSALTSSSALMSAELEALDPDFPANLLKCPSRSVAVKGLTKSISFDQLRCSLEPFGSVCGFAMGRSGSTVFVEFENEESCEKALQAAKLKISEKILIIFRVYAPKSSVVRISNVKYETSKSNKLQSICGELGKIKRVVQRSGTVFDVHFCIEESANILNIINRLNGSLVYRNQWVVQPSTFVPVGIIQSFWNSEEGRKQLQKIFQNICAKIAVQNATNISSLTRLSQEYTKDS